MASSFRLSFAAIDILLEHLELGPAPFPFEIPHHGQTDDQRADIRARVFADLDREDLATEATDAVTLFARPEVVITAFGKLDGSVPLFARICRTGQRALQAVGEPGSVRFGHIRPTAIVSSAVELLPAERAGAGQPVIISQGAQGFNDGGVLQRVRPPATGPAAQLYKARLMLRQEKLRLGQFRVSVRSRHGGETHGPDLFWYDTTPGRYAMTSSAGRDGQLWTTFSPADNARIAQLLSAQLSTLLGAR